MLLRLRRWKRLWCSAREARRFLDGVVAGLCECGVLVRLFLGFLAVGEIGGWGKW